MKEYNVLLSSFLNFELRQIIKLNKMLLKIIFINILRESSGRCGSSAQAFDAWGFDSHWGALNA